MIPFFWGTWYSQMQRRKTAWLLLGVGGRENGELFNGDSVFVLQDEKSSGRWSRVNVSVLNTTELESLGW